ncbi:MAG TPA: PaaI family thioesterase [Candidatus Krumholzibacteria bacterium]|nr:PaaI family thioesterase [Candidatus Krumholzibacteria bacterium]
MTAYTPQNPDFRDVVRESFSRQLFMGTLGARLVHVEPGDVRIAMPHAAAFTQQNGFIHAGAVSSIADSANGYAALSLCPPGYDVLAVEFKINLLSPASTPWLLACGSVLRPGRTLTTCYGEVWGIAEASHHVPAGARRIATLLSTIIARRADE